MKKTDVDYRCRDCGVDFAAPDDAAARMSYPCPKCGSAHWGPIPGNPPKVMFASSDLNWHSENGGRGRHISQLELPLDEKVDAGLNIRQNDNFAYCKSRQEIVEKAARRGYKITSGAPRSARSIKSK